MFGIKKLQKEVDELKQYLEHYNNLSYKRERTYFDEIDRCLTSQKLDISTIKTKFHDLGEKFEKNQEAISQLSTIAINNTKNMQHLMDKIVTDEAVMQHIKELNEKMNFLFDYMKQLEKLLGNVELIVDQCLPEKTLKLPKKKKAITEAS